MNKNEPKRCIDPVMKFCQQCRYGVVVYPDDVETPSQVAGCVFETFCMYGLENTKPTAEEIKMFNESYND